MAVGSSGRVVVEISPELKQELHAVLRLNGSNLKEWFVQQALDYVRKNGGQLPLSLEQEREFDE